MHCAGLPNIQTAPLMHCALPGRLVDASQSTLKWSYYSPWEVDDSSWHRDLCARFLPPRLWSSRGKGEMSSHFYPLTDFTPNKTLMLCAGLTNIQMAPLMRCAGSADFGPAQIIPGSTVMLRRQVTPLGQCYVPVQHLFVYFFVHAIQHIHMKSAWNK